MVQIYRGAVRLLGVQQLRPLMELGTLAQIHGSVGRGGLTISAAIAGALPGAHAGVAGALSTLSLQSSMTSSMQAMIKASSNPGRDAENQKTLASMTQQLHVLQKLHDNKRKEPELASPTKPGAGGGAAGFKAGSMFKGIERLPGGNINSPTTCKDPKCGVATVCGFSHAAK